MSRRPTIRSLRSGRAPLSVFPRTPAPAFVAVLAMVLVALSGCTFGPGLTNKTPSPTQKGPGDVGHPGGEGEGEGSTGVVLQCPQDASAASLDAMVTQYKAQIAPLMTRPAAEGGCLECHGTDSGRQMTMIAGDDASTFYRIRAGGFFRLVTNAIPERVIHGTMPQSNNPPAPPHLWSDNEKDAMLKFACNLATLDNGGTPLDEQFPSELTQPYTGPAITDYDNTFLTFEQLKGRVIQAFDDDWVRNGVDEFSQNIALFGGADFINTFVPARDATPEFFDGLDTLAEDVCGRAATNETGPFDQLDLDASIASEAASTTQTFEAETSTIVGDACLPGSGATSVVLCTNSSLNTTVTLPSAGDYDVVALANGDEATTSTNNELPNLEVQIDGTAVADIGVPHTTNFSTYTASNIHIDAGGSHTLTIAFTNDCCGSGNGDRNLHVDKFSIVGPKAGSTGGSANGAQDARTKLITVFSRILLRPPHLNAGQPDDEIDPLYALLTDLDTSFGDRRAAWAGVCQGLVQHPDFLFTRPPSFDTATGGDRERLLVIKTALDLVNRPPNADEFAQFDSGQKDRAALIDTWLQSDEFVQAYNTRIRAILEFDGTPDGDEPSRLWTYVMKNDRPLKEILTADYTVDENGNQITRPAEHGATGILTMKGYIKGKPGLPHFNYAARVWTGFMGQVFNVPQAALDARATATAASTVDPTSICYSCHQMLTPLAYQRQKWDDDGNFRECLDDPPPAAGQPCQRPIDDTDQGLVPDYEFKGPGIESFTLVAVRKEGFIRRMCNVHFALSFGRNMRHDQDERDVYASLWNVANSGNGTFRDILKTVLLSRSYTNPPAPTTGGAP